MENKVLILSAPSGCGKTTILKALMARQLPLEFSVSATSRQKREGETDGRDYYFFTPEQFREKVEQGAFLEWNEVYTGQYYGTLLSEVDRIAQNGRHVIFDVDVLGGLNLKKIFGDKALAVFIQPPTVEALRERLCGRGTEDEASLKKRLAKAEYELSFADQFDTVIVNDILKTAQEEAVEKVNAFLK